MADTQPLAGIFTFVYLGRALPRPPVRGASRPLGRAALVPLPQCAPPRPAYGGRSAAARVSLGAWPCACPSFAAAPSHLVAACPALPCAPPSRALRRWPIGCGSAVASLALGRSPPAAAYRRLGGESVAIQSRLFAAGASPPRGALGWLPLPRFGSRFP